MNSSLLSRKQSLAQFSVNKNQVATRNRTRQTIIASADSNRPYGTWLPGVLPPAHLKGEAPGDFAFDPLSLGIRKDRFEWYAEGEKYNGRWAMAGVVGILGQELLGVEPKWFEAGGKDYGIPFQPLLAVEFIIFGFLEYTRLVGFQKTGKSGVINTFPFDPLKLDSPTNAVKEIKNARLAMIAFTGFWVQALVTREGPIEGLKNHIADPLGHNLIANLTHLPAFAGTATGGTPA